MAGNLFEGVSLKVRVIFLSMTMGAILVPVLLIAIFAHPQPISRSSVMGCYAAPGAPSLDVGSTGITIMEPERRKFSYLVEPDKQGYRFNVRPALSLRPIGRGRYVFTRDERGIGYFWSLLPTKSDDPRNVRGPKDYGGRFQVIANDGTAIVFGRIANAAKCI